MSNSIRIDDLAAEINSLVEDYGKHCAATTKECVNNVAKRTVAKLKQKFSGSNRKIQKRMEEDRSKRERYKPDRGDPRYKILPGASAGERTPETGRRKSGSIKHVEPAEQAAIAELEKEIASKL